MTYKELKKRIKNYYDIVKVKSHFELSSVGIEKDDVLFNLELFIIFCFETEYKKNKNEKIDMNFIREQVNLINQYIKELEKSIKNIK